MAVDDEILAFPEVKKWIDGITNKKTATNYLLALRTFVKWSGINPTQLIDEALKDTERNIREKQNVVQNWIIGFHKYLVNDLVRIVKVRGEKKKVKGISPYSANMLCMCVRSFFAEYGIHLKLRGHKKIPVGVTAKENEKYVWGMPEIRKLLDNALTKRDRVIILMTLQGGFSLDTLCKLKYIHVKDGLMKDEYPLRIDTIREKADQPYWALIGKDTIEAIKVYLVDLKDRGIELADSDPLLIRLGKSLNKKVAMEPHLVEEMIRDLVVKCGYKLESNQYNRYGMHSLRVTMATIAHDRGMPKEYIEFLIGHKKKGLDKAYFKTIESSVREAYMKIEKYLSPLNNNGNGTKIDELKNELDTTVKGMSETINKLVEDNQKMRYEIKAMMEELAFHKNQIAQIAKETDNKNLEAIVESLLNKKKAFEQKIRK